MPKRTRSHEIEERSRVGLRQVFGGLGWVVWDLYPDYGEDLLVRIFLENKATHYSFFIQAKATDHIDRYMDKETRYLNFPIDRDHLEHWKHFWEPVILTVWDATSDITYWEILQDYLESNDIDTSYKRLSVTVPTTNILDSKGLRSIFERTLLRFKRFELTCEGVDALMDFLEERFNVNVSYKHGESVIGINYDENSEVGKEFILLGDTAEHLNKIAEKMGLTEEKCLMHMVHKSFDKVVKELGCVPLDEFVKNSGYSSLVEAVKKSGYSSLDEAVKKLRCSSLDELVKESGYSSLDELVKESGYSSFD